MTKVSVEPGNCGFTATVTVEKIDKRRLSCHVESDCEAARTIKDFLPDIDKWEILKPRSQSQAWSALNQCPLHLSCPVPVAIIKAAEVEAGLALARDVSIHFLNE